jgi:hypothetical protein
MKLFFISGNIGSILSFLFSLNQFASPESKNWFIVSLLIWAFLTLLFWVYFYFRPNNPMAKKFNENLDFSGSYIDKSGKSMDIVEGYVKVDTVGWGATVTLPPFQEVPNVSILSKKGGTVRKRPEVYEITADSFRVIINSSEQSGEWRWRVRGILLESANKNGKK